MNQKKDKTRILIFPAGSEIGLEIFDSLRYEKDLEIFGGSSFKDFSSMIYPKSHLKKIPHVDTENFIFGLLSVCKKSKINVIYPAHDQVIKLLAESRKLLEKENIHIIAHPGNTSTVCRSKYETYKKLGKKSFLPKYFTFSESNKPTFNGPYFLKPIAGQGSKGIYKANSFSDIVKLSEQVSLKEYIVCELLPGAEFTVDCFTDFEGKLLFCEGRERAQTTNGISVATSITKDPSFRKIALEIQKKIPMNGAWFFQVKRDRLKKLRLLEVGARIAGSSTYARFCGTNLSMMNLFNLKNIKLKVLPIETRITVKKRIKAYSTFDYPFDNVYIDLDDTLIVNQEINLKVIHFVYWCINNKKKLILVTRHKFDLTMTLEKFKLNSLFDEIVHLTNGESKCLTITSKKSIFIDDSFVERSAVSGKHKIPVYSTQCLPEVY